MLLSSLLVVVITGSVLAAPVPGLNGDTLIGCKDKPVEVYFLLDCSSSVWVVHYKKQLDFVVSLVQKFHIDPTATRVGLGVFSDDFHPVIDIGNYTDERQLIQKIRDTPYLFGNTYTGKGLHGLRTQGFRSVRPNVTKVGIVVTDGRSRHRSNTVAEAAMAREENIWLFAIGVGNNVDMEELSTIASDPKADFALHVGSFDILTTLADNLAISSCQLEQPQADGAVCGQKNKADVVFVYNAAGMTSRNVTNVRQFTTAMVDEFSMTSGNVRVGVISGGCQGGDIELSQHLRRADFVNALMGQNQPTLNPLVKKLRLQGYDPARGGRRDAKKMAVIFVDGALNALNDLLYEALLLKYADVQIYVIAVGQSYEYEEVKHLATSESHIFSYNGYSQLSNQEMRGRFKTKFCEEL